jgi:hypothetical protein
MSDDFVGVAAVKQAGVMNASGNALFDVGKIYTGTVVSVNAASGHCVIRTDNPAATLENVYWAAGAIMAPLLGFKIKTVPPVGGRVAVLYGNTSFVIQALPTEPGDMVAGGAKTSTGSYTRKESKVYGKTAGTFHALTTGDILEGEFDLSNAFGVGLLFLNNLMMMKSGDKAKIETHLLRDMVRVISENFEHFHSAGSEDIYNDGRVNVERSLNSYEHETGNRLSAKTPKAATKKNQVKYNHEKDIVDNFQDRYRQYEGWLGDFIHEFIKEPARSASAILTGKGSHHVNADGSFLQRTTGEIVLERVCRQLVPKRLKRHYDPEGDKAEDFEDLDTEPIRTWKEGDTPQDMAYQMREYARYLSNFKSLERFRQLKKDFEIATEEDTPAPDPNNWEEDKRKTNSGLVYIETYSTIRIFRDGSIVLMDGYGSSVYMGRGFVQISAPRDVHVDCGGDFVVVANNIFQKARKTVEITSVEEDMFLKARKGMNILSEEGTVYIKSDAEEDTESTSESGEGGENSVKTGVFIDVPKHSLTILANKDILAESEKGDIGLTATREKIILDGKKLIKLDSKRNITCVATRDFQFNGNDAFFRPSGDFIVSDKFKINSSGNASFAKKVAVADTLRVGGNIFGPAISKGDPAHTNHIRVGGPGNISINGDGNSENIQNDINERLKQTVQEVAAGYEWKYNDDAHHQYEQDSEDALHLPHAQDYIETHSDEDSDYSEYEEWEFSDDHLQNQIRTDASSLPWPGKNNTEEKIHPFDAGEVLDKPSTEDTWNQTDLTSRPTKRKVRP